jgi:peptidoglycan L-alanyl-D-glutamate endopeptidase CwlK
MVTLLRLIGLLWALPVALPIWLCYLLPAWALGWLKLDGMARWCVVRFRVNDKKDSWYTRAWDGWAGFAAPYAVLLKHGSVYSTELHELRHTDQWLLLGPLFPVVYGALLAVAGYHENYLEADARRYAARRWREVKAGGVMPGLPIYKFGQKSLDRLEQVHPNLVLVVSRGLLYSQFDFAVSEGVRTPQRQRELVAKGMSDTLQSKHLLQADGYGHAVDVMAVGDLDGDGDVDAQDKSRTWDPVIYTGIADAMKRASAELGIPIRWGGEFKHRNGKPFFDGPHFELA